MSGNLDLVQTPTLTHRATHAAWWSAVEIIARYGMQFVVTVVLARLLEPADFGLMAMLLVFTTFAALLAEGGLSSALVQKQDTTHDDETSVFLINLGMSFMLTALLRLSAPAIARFYAHPMLAPLLHLLVWVLPLSALAAVPNAILSQRLDFRTRTTAELIASPCSAALALWLAWRGYGVWSLVWQALAGAGLRALLLWLLSGWRPRGRFDGQAFARLFRFSGFLLLANVLNLASIRLQSLLIGRLFDARALGFYSLAQDTQQAPAQFMTGLLNRVGLPMFSAVAAQPEKLAGALRLSLQLSMFVFTPCMVGIAATSTPLILLLYGPAWTPAAPLLSILALSAAFWPLHVLNLAAISALGRSDLVLKLEIAKALTTIPLILIAAPFGVMAIAWSVLLSNLLCAVINAWHSHKLLGYGFQAQLRASLPTFLLTFLAAIGMVMASILTTNTVLNLAIAITVGSSIYIAGAVIFKLQAGRGLWGFLKALYGSHFATGDNKQ